MNGYSLEKINKTGDTNMKCPICESDMLVGFVWDERVQENYWIIYCDVDECQIYLGLLNGR